MSKVIVKCITPNCDADASQVIVIEPKVFDFCRKCHFLVSFLNQYSKKGE